MLTATSLAILSPRLRLRGAAQVSTWVAGLGLCHRRPSPAGFRCELQAFAPFWLCDGGK
jgi:hypothetical protein